MPVRSPMLQRTKLLLAGLCVALLLGQASASAAAPGRPSIVLPRHPIHLTLGDVTHFPAQLENLGSPHVLAFQARSRGRWVTMWAEGSKPEGPVHVEIGAAEAGTYRLRIAALRKGVIETTATFTLIATTPAKPPPPPPPAIPPPPAATGIPSTASHRPALTPSRRPAPSGRPATGSPFSPGLATGSALSSTYGAPFVGCGGEANSGMPYSFRLNELVVAPNIFVRSGAQWWAYTAYSYRWDGSQFRFASQGPVYTHYEQPPLTGNIVTIGPGNTGSAMPETRFEVTGSGSYYLVIVRYWWANESGTSWIGTDLSATGTFGQYSPGGGQASSQLCYVWGNANGTQ